MYAPYYFNNLTSVNENVRKDYIKNMQCCTTEFPCIKDMFTQYISPVMSGYVFDHNSKLPASRLNSEFLVSSTGGGSSGKYTDFSLKKIDDGYQIIGEKNMCVSPSDPKSKARGLFLDFLPCKEDSSQKFTMINKKDNRTMFKHNSGKCIQKIPRINGQPNGFYSLVDCDSTDNQQIFYLFNDPYVDDKIKIVTEDINQTSPTRLCRDCDPSLKGKDTDKNSICFETMLDFCKKPINFFSPVCKNWLKNVDDSRKDDIASSVCKDYKGDDENGIFCACYNSRLPPEWLDSNGNVKAQYVLLAGVAQCIDQKCGRVDALKPFKYECNIQSVICNNEQNRVDFEKALPGTKVTIQNKCGISGGGGSGGSVTPADDSKTTPADDSKTTPADNSKTTPDSKTNDETPIWKNPWFIGGISLGIFIFLIVIVFISSSGSGSGNRGYIPAIPRIPQIPLIPRFPQNY